MNGPANDKEAAEAERKLRLLIHGPELAEEGAGQDGTDKAAEGETKNITQDEIDRLFA